MSTDGTQELADDLDELRRLAGLSYRDLARRTGCARSTLNDALTARRFPGLDTVLAVVRACGADPREWRPRWAAAKRRRSSPGTGPPQTLRQPQTDCGMAAWVRISGAGESFVVLVPDPRTGER